MKPPPFDYVRPNDIGEVVNLLSESGSDARLLAGGQSLMAMLNMRLLHPSLIIDISGLPDHNFIRCENNVVEIGCATTQRQFQSWAELSDKLPLLSQALPWIGHPQTRNKGTVCGSVAHADPSAELPVCFAALEGVAVLYSSRGERLLGWDELQTGMLETACEPDEMIRAIQFPVSETGTGYAFGEVAYRHGDFAIVSMAVLSKPQKTRMVVGGISDKPKIFEWFPTKNSADLSEMLSELCGQTEIFGDHHATAFYRRSLFRSLGFRLVREASGWVE